MERALKKELYKWKEKEERLPLLIRGARQVGKTYLVETFSRESFESLCHGKLRIAPRIWSLFPKP
jgi:predicted AAA+ superfamily ATPase